MDSAHAAGVEFEVAGYEPTNFTNLRREAGSGNVPSESQVPDFVNFVHSFGG